MLHPLCSRGTAPERARRQAVRLGLEHRGIAYSRTGVPPKGTWPLYARSWSPLVRSRCEHGALSFRSTLVIGYRWPWRCGRVRRRRRRIELQRAASAADLSSDVAPCERAITALDDRSSVGRARWDGGPSGRQQRRDSARCAERRHERHALTEPAGVAVAPFRCFVSIRRSQAFVRDTYRSSGTAADPRFGFGQRNDQRGVSGLQSCGDT